MDSRPFFAVIHYVFRSVKCKICNVIAKIRRKVLQSASLLWYLQGCSGLFFFFSDRQPCRSDLHLLIPRSQPSGRGLLPSPTAWSPDQHIAAVLADVSRHILGRIEGHGLGFGQLVCTHREVSEMPILFRWTLRPQCPVRTRKIVYCAQKETHNFMSLILCNI